MTLFEVAIVEHPAEEGGKSVIRLDPTPVLANDGQQAAINTILDHASELEGIDRDYMEVFVRPFT